MKKRSSEGASQSVSAIVVVIVALMLQGCAHPQTPPPAPPKAENKPAPPIEVPPHERVRVMVFELRGQNRFSDHVMNIIESSLFDGLRSNPVLEVFSADAAQQAFTEKTGRTKVDCPEQDCLAEIVETLGVTAVVHGNVGKLGSTFIVNLNLFRIDSAESLSRSIIRTSRVEDIPENVENAMSAFILPLIPEKYRERVR